MDNNNQNWKSYFKQTNLSGIVRDISNATTALNIAINANLKIIHPGAFLVFCTIIASINERAQYMLTQCDRADLDAFAQSDTEQEI